MHDAAFFNIFSGIWGVFSFSFLVALTGAMSPGPLLTYTIVRTASGGRRGYWMGAWIILGHALLEMAIIILMLLGFSFIFKNTLVMRTIGVIGGAVLVLFGISIIKSIWRGEIATDFIQNPEKTGTAAKTEKPQMFSNPVVGGIFVSMSNPYWWVWWATIGFAFMIQFEVSFNDWTKLLAFFIGHEAGDLAWYLIVSFLTYFSLRRFNRKVYYSILFVCGLFMTLFGVYLGVSPFMQTA